MATPKFSTIITTYDGIKQVRIHQDGDHIGNLVFDAEAGPSWILYLNTDTNPHDTRAKTVKEAKEWAKGYIVDRQSQEQDRELEEAGLVVNQETGEVTMPEGWTPPADQEAGDDGDDDGDGEPAPRTVVKPHYQRLYKEASTSGRSCGDWLAEEIDGMFLAGGPSKKDMYFDYDAFASFLVVNEVQLTGKWAEIRVTRTPGWQGRFRMNGRLKLEQEILRRDGILLFPPVGTDEEPIREQADEGWLATIRRKYPKIVAEAKAKATTEGS